MLIRNMEMIRKNVAVRIDGLPEGEVRIYQQKKNGKSIRKTKFDTVFDGIIYFILGLLTLSYLYILYSLLFFTVFCLSGTVYPVSVE